MEPKNEIEKVSIVANGRGLQLRTIEDMYRFSQFVVKSRLAPSSFITPEQIIIAIQMGAELSMPPMRSLQSFCVVNGQARLWGDAPLALVRQSGLMEYIKESIEGEGENMAAHCETKRKDSPASLITIFSVDDAKQAGLWGKKGTWQLYPKRMLKYRARSFNLRDNFPDCFGGATIAEEYMDVEKPDGKSAGDKYPQRPELTEQNKKVLVAICNKLFESLPDNKQVDSGKVAALFYSRHGRYPENMKQAGKAADWLLDLKQDDSWTKDAKISEEQSKQMADEFEEETLSEATEASNSENEDNRTPEPENVEHDSIDDLMPWYCKAGKHNFIEPDKNGLCPKCLSKDIMLERDR